jgi:hypothetical protein
MKFLSVLALAICISAPAMAANKHKGAPSRNPASANKVCEEKAKALVKAAYITDWSEDEMSEISVAESAPAKGDTHTYSLEVGTKGAKMGMNYKVQVDASGPEACYLNSIRVISN